MGMWVTEPGHPGLPDDQEALGGGWASGSRVIKAFWGKASPGAVGREDTVGEGSRQQAVRCVTTGSAMTQSNLLPKGSLPTRVQQVSISLARPGGLCSIASLKRQTRWLTELLTQNWPWGARGLTPLSPGRNAKSSLDNMLYYFIMPRKSFLMLNLWLSWGHFKSTVDWLCLGLK